MSAVGFRSGLAVNTRAGIFRSEERRVGKEGRFEGDLKELKDKRENYFYSLLDARYRQLISRDALFFFQAEDGIRDPLVTGVQTCALPIFRYLYASGPPSHAPESYR